MLARSGLGSIGASSNSHTSSKWVNRRYLRVSMIVCCPESRIPEPTSRNSSTCSASARRTFLREVGGELSRDVISTNGKLSINSGCSSTRSAMNKSFLWLPHNNHRTCAYDGAQKGRRHTTRLQESHHTALLVGF